MGMDISPMRRSGLSVLGVVVATMLFPVPAAAGGCNLIATSGGGSPAAVNVGDVASIEGFGFALGDVNLAITVDGASVRTETVTAADAFGNVGYFILDITVDQAGFWEIVASEVGGTCSAFEGFPVAPSPASTATAGPLVPDVATAPPRTPPSLAWLLGGALLMLSALIVLRRPSTLSSTESSGPR